jgi:pre-mRNA-splicing factor CWC22
MEWSLRIPIAVSMMQNINDMTSTDLVNLRRTLYLTLMSAATFEEAGHKLMKLNLPPGQEPELCAIIIECCSQEKTFLRFYALLAQRFCLKFQAYW